MRSDPHLEAVNGVQAQILHESFVTFCQDNKIPFAQWEDSGSEICYLLLGDAVLREEMPIALALDIENFLGLFQRRSLTEERLKFFTDAWKTSKGFMGTITMWEHGNTLVEDARKTLATLSVDSGAQRCLLEYLKKLQRLQDKDEKE